MDYGETRCVSLDMLAARLHVLCFTEAEDGIRVISFRKADAHGVVRHAKVHRGRWSNEAFVEQRLRLCG